MPLTRVAISGTHTLTLAEDRAIFDATAATTLTVPNNATVDWPDGYIFTVYATGGAVTMTFTSPGNNNGPATIPVDSFATFVNLGGTDSWAGSTDGPSATQIVLPAVTPTLPVGTADLFTREVAGRMMPAFIGPSGLASILQPGLARNRVGYWSPVGNSIVAPAVSVLGIASPTTLGTATVRNVAVTSLFTSLRRLGYVSSATAGNLAGYRLREAQFWRGDAAGLGGFTYIHRFGTSDAATVAGARQFCGFAAATGAPTNVEPNTLVNIIGVGHGTADANLSIFHNDGSGTATSIALGANFPANTLSVDVYELALFAAPNSSTVGYRVERLNTGNVASGTISTDLPGTTTLLALQAWRTNNATALAVGLDLMSLYIETDY